MVHPGLRRQPQSVRRGGRRGLRLRGVALGDVALAVVRSPAWQDRVWLGLVGAALLLVVALYGFVVVTLPTLPAFLPVHYDASGAVDEIGPREALFRMPIIASVVFLANLLIGAAVHRTERFAALLLEGTAITVVAMLFYATVTIARLAFGD